MSPDDYIDWSQARPSGGSFPPAGPPPVDSTNPAYSSPPGQRPPGGRRIAAALTVLALLGAGAGVWALSRGDGTDESAAAPARSTPTVQSTSASPPPRTAPSMPPPMPRTTETSASTPTARRSPALSAADAEALGDLKALVAADSPGIVLDGHFVAQIGTKAAGLVDPLDPPPAGGRSWDWQDVLKQHLRHRDDDRFRGQVRLLLSTRFGKGVTTEDGRPYYVTIVDPGYFASADEVRAWCRDTFSELSGRRLANACVPAKLRPVGGD